MPVDSGLQGFHHSLTQTQRQRYHSLIIYIMCRQVLVDGKNFETAIADYNAAQRLSEQGTNTAQVLFFTPSSASSLLLLPRPVGHS